MCQRVYIYIYIYIYFESVLVATTWDRNVSQRFRIRRPWQPHSIGINTMVAHFLLVASLIYQYSMT
jgi:hypothetical protein